MKTTIKLLDVVALLQDIPGEGLTAGEMGTVVEVFEPGVFYVEFSDNLGRAYAFATLRADQLLRLHSHQASKEETAEILG